MKKRPANSQQRKKIIAKRWGKIQEIKVFATQ